MNSRKITLAIVGVTAVLAILTGTSLLMAKLAFADVR